MELLFSGVSGFSLSNGATIISDWLTFSFAITDSLVVDMDVAAGGAGGITFLDSISGCNGSVGTLPGYNAIDPGCSTSGSGRDFCVQSIETQAGGASGGLRFNSNMDGLGASGAFFRDPLAGRRSLGWRQGLVMLKPKRLLRPQIRIAA